MRKGLVFLFLALSVTLLGLLLWGKPALAAPLDPPARLERTLIENPSDYGQYASMALHPTTGAPWISYWYSATNELRLAKYVGVGGNCGNGSWSCSTVSTGILPPRTPITGGMYSSLDFTPEGRPVIAFYGGADGLTIRVARYTCPTIICSWTVTNVYDAYYFGGRGDLSLKVGSDGKARLAAYIPGFHLLWNSKYGKLVYMQERGDTSGTGCLTNTWQCDTVEEGSSDGGVGKHASLELYKYNPPGYIEPNIAYYDTQNGDLKYAYRPMVVGTGNCGPGGNSWTCQTIDAIGDVGQYAVLAKDLSLSDKRWQIAYYDATNQALKFAYNIAAGGNCGFGDATGKWECFTIEGPAVGTQNGIGTMEGHRVFSVATYQGHTAIAYYDNDDSSFNGTLKWARDGYGVGDGGNCGPKKSLGIPPYVFHYSTWRCDTLDSGLYFSGGFPIFRDVGQYPTIAYRSDGMARIAYYDVKSGLRYLQQNYAVYLPLTLKNQ